MTATTSKLGADMKDHEIAQTVNQLRDIAKEYGQTQQLRERIAAVIVPILARQPAAIDKNAVSGWKLVPVDPTPKMIDEAKRYTWVAEEDATEAGIWRHMLAASPAAPSVEQDERGAFEEAARICEAEAKQHKPSWEDYSHQACLDCAEAIRARAASTSANVAQGAEADTRAAVATLVTGPSGCSIHMPWTPDIQFGEGFTIQPLGFVTEQPAPMSGIEAAAWNAAAKAGVDGEQFITMLVDGGFDELLAALPAQTAIADDARDAARYRWLRRRAFMLDESDDAVTTISLFKDEGPTGEFLDDQIDAALTDAQSASGADHAN